jgi:mannose-6-phosphate isomerase-like protein (cupin superfamily)
MEKTAKLVVTGEDGKTRFTETTVEFVPVEGVSPGGVFQAAALGSSDAALVQFEADFSCEFHHTPSPTWMFVMTGQMEIEVSDGAKQIISPGDFIRLEDSSGRGHRSRVLSDGPVLVATAGYSA